MRRYESVTRRSASPVARSAKGFTCESRLELPSRRVGGLQERSLLAGEQVSKYDRPKAILVQEGVERGWGELRSGQAMPKDGMGWK